MHNHTLYHAFTAYGRENARLPRAARLSNWGQALFLKQAHSDRARVAPERPRRQPAYPAHTQPEPQFGACHQFEARGCPAPTVLSKMSPLDEKGSISGAFNILWCGRKDLNLHGVAPIWT